MATILNGKETAAALRAEIAQKTADFKKRRGYAPTLAVVLVGNDPASQIYVRNKQKACEEVGIVSRLIKLPESIGESDLLAEIGRLADDPAVHGILVQLPLPAPLDEARVIAAIPPAKDVDGFHPVNAGKLLRGEDAIRPCTPAGIMELLRRYGIAVEGKQAVVVGRSNIVGKPTALALLAENATVTVCHSKTRDLAAVTKTADILVVAVGKAGLIRGDMVKPGAVVIDVGMNRGADGKLVGDVDFASVEPVASAITPVPGGVGPMTIAMLMKNTLTAAKISAD